MGVIGLILRAVLSQVQERTFLRMFFCDRYHLLMNLGVGNIDQKLLKLLKTLKFRKLLILLYNLDLRNHPKIPKNF